MQNQIILRDYQKKQLEFINSRLEKNRKTIAIQSPTGSGKSYVILQFVKEYFEKHKNKDCTIVFATGFNNLIFQLLEDSKKFGLEPLVWVGFKASTCGLKYMEKNKTGSFPTLKDIDAFDPNQSYRPSVSRKFCIENCIYCKHKCLYTQRRKQVSEGRGHRFIITNHSMYTISIRNQLFMPDVTFIDEAHSYPQFYESLNNITIRPDEIAKIQNFFKYSNNKIFDIAVENVNNGRECSDRMINELVGKLVDSNKFYPDLINRFVSFISYKPSVSSFCEVNKYGINITNFFVGFGELESIKTQHVLLSATIDRYTMDIFNVVSNDLYIEKTFRNNYEESKYITFIKSHSIENKDDYKKLAVKSLITRLNKGLLEDTEENRKKFQTLDDINNYADVKNDNYTFREAVNAFFEYITNNNINNGLFLSTTNENVGIIKNDYQNFNGYKIFTDKKLFEEAIKNSDKNILVGSRRYFQGVNIPGLDFVCIDKIPFPSYDDKFVAYQNYYELMTGKNSWFNHTMPKTSNDIIQTTGRLWRNKDDKGYVFILDPRINGKFKSLNKFVNEVRIGIKEEIIDINSDNIDKELLIDVHNEWVESGAWQYLNSREALSLFNKIISSGVIKNFGHNEVIEWDSISGYDKEKEKDIKALTESLTSFGFNPYEKYKAYLIKRAKYLVKKDEEYKENEYNKANGLAYKANFRLKEDEKVDFNLIDNILVFFNESVENIRETYKSENDYYNSFVEEIDDDL